MFKPIVAACLFATTAFIGCEDTATTQPPAKTMQAISACEDFKVNITDANPSYAWTPNAIRLVSEEVAPNVFAVYDSNAATYGPAGTPLATSGGFVIGDNGVLVVETMINRQLFCQMVALVREKTDKPITHAVNTSSHGDHSFGNTFLPSGVHIVQHEVTAAYIAQHFAEDVAFMEANFGKDQGLDEVKPVTADTIIKSDPLMIDLGGISVKVQFHGFAQTGGDLFVEVPSVKVVWTGNPLIAEKPAIPWLLDGHAQETAATLAMVRDALPPDAIVIAGHDRPLKVADFNFSIDYLNAMISEVDAAIKQGLSEPDTVGQVTMAPFQGYKLWGWIHTTVNVPKTYQELKP